LGVFMVWLRQCLIGDIFRETLLEKKYIFDIVEVSIYANIDTKFS
jgi:hypothetical protein